MKKILKWTIVGALLAVIAVGGFGLWILFGSKTSNPHNYKTIGDIPEPWGYERISGDDAGYAFRVLGGQAGGEGCFGGVQGCLWQG